jgi:hypothetical protein
VPPGGGCEQAQDAGALDDFGPPVRAEPSEQAGTGYDSGRPEAGDVYHADFPGWCDAVTLHWHPGGFSRPS